MKNKTLETDYVAPFVLLLLGSQSLVRVTVSLERLA